MSTTASQIVRRLGVRGTRQSSLSSFLVRYRTLARGDRNYVFVALYDIACTS